MWSLLGCLVLIAMARPVGAADEGVLLQSGFEKGLGSWGDLWTREKNAGKVQHDRAVAHSGRGSARVEHRGQQDWSWSPDEPPKVKPGDWLQCEAWVKVQGDGSVTLCFVTYDANGKVLRWVENGASVRGTRNWHRLRTNVIIADPVARVMPRLIGEGPATVWVDDVVLIRKGNVKAMRGDAIPQTISFSNEFLDVTFNADMLSLTVTDKRTQDTWSQAPARHGIILRGVNQQPRGVNLELLALPMELPVEVDIQLADHAPEITVEMKAEGPLPQPLSFPLPFVTDQGTFVILPMNEGISYPVDDESIPPWNTYLYGGHGLCMAFYGATDLRTAYMVLVETPDDAGMNMQRIDGKLCLAPRWDAQKGVFGYPRKLRYVFFDQGGYVAMCKRYRSYVKAQGRLRTLEEKRRRNPNVDKLLGAVNVWCWDNDPVSVCRELQQSGIQRILWSHRSSPEQIRQMNEMGVLTSRYDIFQDVMNPANRLLLRGWHPDWPDEAWPDDLMIGPDGEWIRGWRVRGKDGKWYPCGVLCDRKAPDYARRRIGSELKTHPYQSRFIDTTTASPWRECYNPKHPMTRSDSRHWKMELLRVVSEEFNLVCGSETGHDAAVPYVHYFEGMLSLGPYRVPDAGRNMMKIWDTVPERVAKFQTGHFYRLPLWELVYHDCVVAQWYWGDYNNKLPAVWDRRDLFNVLYGTPPMFMFNRGIWNRYRDRFVQSYQTVCPTVRRVAYQKMTSHRWLTPDHTVQETEFANGVRVVVNFGEKDFQWGDRTIPPGSHVVVSQ